MSSVLRPFSLLIPSNPALFGGFGPPNGSKWLDFHAMRKEETSERQEQARAIYGDISSLGSGLGDRLGRLEGTCHSMRQDRDDGFQWFASGFHELFSYSRVLRVFVIVPFRP